MPAQAAGGGSRRHGVDLQVMEKAVQILWEVLTHTWAVLGEMAPWVLGGFFVAGVLSLWLNARVVREHFGAGRRGAILKAVLLGVPLPVCSCGVIPLGASLRKHGAGKGATAAFLMSTPQTGVDSVAVTYGLMGGLFAVFRPLAALVSGLLCGFAVEVAAGGDSVSPAPPEEPEIESETRLWWARILHNGFIVLPRSVGGALLTGAVISGAIMALVPENWIAERISSPLLQMVLTLAVSVPVYICSTAAVPFAVGMLAAGLSPGAAMAFLVGGPGVSASTILAVWRLMGLRTAGVYLGVLTVCALGFGLLVQAWIPAGWMPPGIRLVNAHAHCAEGLAWSVHARALLLLAVVAWAKWGRRKKHAGIGA